jgi:O-antigen/teichoic acid export membrane protein
MVLKSILSFTKQASIYGVGNAINSVLAFFLIPLYLRNLTIEEYGVYGLLIIVIQIVTRFGNLGIEASMMRSFYDYQNKKDQGKVLMTSFIMMISTLFVISLLSVILNDLINLFLFSENNYSNLIVYSVFIGALRALRKLPQSILRIKTKSVLYTTLEVVNFAVGLSVLIYLLEFKDLGLEGLIYGTFISMIFNTVVFYSFVIKYYTIGFLSDEVKKQLKFGIPLLPAAVSSLIFVFSGRYFLEHYHSLELVGIFTLLFQLAGMLETFMGQPIKLAWQPYFLENYKETGSEVLFKNIVKIIAIASLFIALCMSLFAEPLFNLLAKPSYLQAVKYLPIMLIFYSFLQFQTSNTNIIHFQ